MKGFSVKFSRFPGLSEKDWLSRVLSDGLPLVSVLHEKIKVVDGV